MRESILTFNQNGFEEVYHLKGGILNYLENINSEKVFGKNASFSTIEFLCTRS